MASEDDLTGTTRVGDLVLHAVSGGRRWVVTLGDSLDIIVGSVYTVVEPGERWRGWYVALRPDDVEWMLRLPPEEVAKLDADAVRTQFERMTREPNVAGWGRSVEQAAAHLQAAPS